MMYHPENIAPDGKRFHSKSELLIYLCLLFECGGAIQWGVNAWYERRLAGTAVGGRWSQFPDFTFADSDGNLLLWEHLGMKGDERYDADWAKKLEWYGVNGYDPGTNMVLTYDTVSLHRRNSTFIDCQSIVRREIAFVRDWVSR